MSKLARQAPPILAVGVFAGLLFPGLAMVLRPLLAPCVWGLLVLAMFRTDWPELARRGRRFGLIALIVAWLLLISPVMIAIALDIAGAPASLTAAMVLMASAPPIMSAPALALLIGLDAPLMLVVMIAATFAVPVVLPVMALELLSLPLDVGAGALMLRLGGVIGTAAVAAAAGRMILRRRRTPNVAPALDLVALILLLTFAVAIMDGVTERLVDQPYHVLTLLAAAFAGNVALQAMAAVAFAWLDRRSSLTAAFASGNRNMGLVLAVLPSDIDPDVLLYFALGQIPIYIMPALLTPLYRRLLLVHTA